MGWPKILDQVSGGGVSLGGLAIKSFAVSCPSRKYLSGRQRVGRVFIPGTDALGLGPSP